MKRGNLLSLSAGVMVIATLVSCSQDPILPPNSAVMEEYTKSFVKEFGIPAPGHSYATAVQAGLKVTTKTGGHVLVTAEVDGKEYRFANIDVPAGTHALPVTIPSCVERLKVKNGIAEKEVGINDIVDLDALSRPAGSRGYDLSISADGYLKFEEDGEEAPMLAFNPDELLKPYFDAHPIGGGESTDYRYMGKDVGDGAFEPNSDPYNRTNIWYGETALGSTWYGYINDESGNPIFTIENTEYYIFPVWWRKNRYGTKDYKLYISQFDYVNNNRQMPFNVTDDTQIPFPGLGYSTEKIEMTGETDELSKFSFDNGSFERAFDPATARTIVTKGTKVTFALPENPGSYCGAGFVLESSDNKGGKSVSCSQPYWNTRVWNDKYFDQSITNLMFTTVSTTRYELTESVDLTGLNFTIDKGDIYGDSDRLPFLLGFTSGPDKAADDATARDYTDFIMLVIPINRMQTLYIYNNIPEPFIWTLAAEDLGATDDWDFNDVVLHFTDEIVSLNLVNLNKKATCIEGPLQANMVRLFTVEPVATGGTMPVYVTFTGRVKDIAYLPENGDEMFSAVNSRLGADTYEQGTFILGTEVHKWLGNTDYTKFINVGSRRQPTNARKVSFVVDPNQDMFTGGGYYNGTGDVAYVSGTNIPLLGFALLVDRGNELQIDAREDKGYVHMPNLKLGEDTYLIGRPSENGTAAPQLFIMSGDWEWPTERTKISDAYPMFNDWITNPMQAISWYHSSNSVKKNVTAR